MKKTLLNLAVTMALSSAVFSGSVLSSQAYADDLISNNDTNNESASENYMYPGFGVGAATGTLIAGPIGLVVGGLIGAFIGSSQEKDSDLDNTIETSTTLANIENSEDITVSYDTAENVTNSVVSTGPDNKSDYLSDNDPTAIAESASNADNPKFASLQVARLGPINTLADDPTSTQQDALIDIFTADLSLDIYFRSGSTNIESFYPARLAAIADLLQNMDQLELHLDGYTDRRGDKSQNIALANRRIENVRQLLISAGVDENRIISKAFGEMKMISAAGDLEAYTFDRKVVIRFQRSGVDSLHTMATALSSSNTVDQQADAVLSENAESLNPVVANVTTRF